MTIKAETTELILVADDVEVKIQHLEQAFRDIEQRVNTSQGYWVGEGNTSYLKAYRKKYGDIMMALRRFQENVMDLRTVAGVYEKAEREALSYSEKLPADVII